MTANFFACIILIIEARLSSVELVMLLLRVRLVLIVVSLQLLRRHNRRRFVRSILETRMVLKINRSFRMQLTRPFNQRLFAVCEDLAFVVSDNLPIYTFFFDVILSDLVRVLKLDL